MMSTENVEGRPVEAGWVLLLAAATLRASGMTIAQASAEAWKLYHALQHGPAAEGVGDDLPF